MSTHELDAPTLVRLAPLCIPDTRDNLLDRLCEVSHSIPDAVAVVAGDVAITFDGLLHRTYASARKIAGLVPDSRRPIAVDATCTVDSIVLMLAVIASGNALVPLDANLPENRIQQIVESASALRLDTDDLAKVEDSAAPLPTIAGNQTALIAFTSGSTGAAKGVLLSHRMSLRKAYEVSSALGLGPRDRVGNALPVSFGAGINTLFAGLLSGSTVHCRDPRTSHEEDLPEWIERCSLTTLHCSPSLVRSLSSAPDASPVHAVPSNLVPTLRVVTTYGEALHARDVLTFRAELGSGAEVVNWYATTEAGAVAYNTFPGDRPLPSGFLPAGSIPRGKVVEVVDEDGFLAPLGDIGEIRVTAQCLADGYLDLPELTRAKFTVDGGHYRYLTGDLGRFDADGTLHLAGRADDAIKIRGYLVEPAEVEAALRRVDGVSDVALISRTVDGIAHIEAFYVGSSVAPDDVREAISADLPHWMVPKHLVQREKIDRNERGKVDRSKLPVAGAHSPQSIASGNKTFKTVTEKWVANIVRTELDEPGMGADSDFTELGATSLALTTISVGIERSFHVKLSTEDLFGAMTIRRLAALVDERLASNQPVGPDAGAESIVVPLRKSGTLTPLFVVAGGGVPAIGLAALARRIDSARPVYAIQARGIADRALPNRTVGGMARTYIRELRKVQPIGPYVLAGHSLGAWIALEMAHRLRADGHEVEHVVLLDPRLYRLLLDRLPGGKGAEAAPVLPATPPGAKNSRMDLVRSVARIVGAGIFAFPTTERWLTFGVIGSLALRIHRPTPWDGPVSVVITGDNTAARASWETLATGKLDIAKVGGRHVDMVREPVAAHVAEIIDSSLPRRA